MVSRLVVTGPQVVSWVRFGVRGSVSEALKLLHVIGGLHLDQVLSHGNKLVHLISKYVLGFPRRNYSITLSPGNPCLLSVGIILLIIP